MGAVRQQRGLRPGDDVRSRGRYAGRRRAYPPPFYEQFTTLAWLAGITERIELGTTVTVLPYRNPVLTARMAATIDQISGGQFILGVGVGWSKQEYAAIGVPFERRGAITDEYLAAIRELWTTEVAAYNGEFVSFGNIYTAPSPARRPHLPIWVGGTSTRGAAPRRCVRRRLAPQQRRTRLAPHPKAADTTVDGGSHGTPHPRVVPADAPAPLGGRAEP
jgi:probable F420-dependent oxidoreductase